MKIEAKTKQVISNEDMGSALAQEHPHNQAHVFAAYLKGLDTNGDFEANVRSLDRSFAKCMEDGEYELMQMFFELMHELQTKAA